MPVAVNAAQLVLTPLNVIGSSGFYTTCCSFAPGNILDQQIGAVTESFGAGYWLNADDGPAAAFITVDLGGVTNLAQVSLNNTYNGVYDDRGTGNFSTFGSNLVLAGSLVAPTLLVSGTLAAQNAGPIIAQTFALGGSYRYISFNPTGVASAVPICCGSANNYGLNEMRVFAVPEPQSWALMLVGFGIVGATMRRRTLRAD